LLTPGRRESCEHPGAGQVLNCLTTTTVLPNEELLRVSCTGVRAGRQQLAQLVASVGDVITVAVAVRALRLNRTTAAAGGVEEDRLLPER
jgi:hypothetical protein